MATIYDIAGIAKVSPQTVCRVLSNQKKENRPSSIARSAEIRRIAEELGYRPNTAAKAVAKGRFNCLGLLRGTGPQSSKVPVAMLDGMQQALSARAMHLALTTLPDEDLTDPAVVPKILDSRMCDGLLVDYTDHVPEGLETLIVRHRVPAVWINRKLPYDAVYADELAGGQAVTRHLLGLGFRQVAYIDLSHPQQTLGQAHYSAIDRETGYAQAMRSVGRKPDVWRPEARLAAEDRVAWIRAAFSRRAVPQAFVSYGDRTTHPLCHALAVREGLAAPRTPVIEFGQRPDHWHGQRAYWHEPTFEVGRRAVDLLVERIATDRPLPADPVAGTACFDTDPAS